MIPLQGNFGAFNGLKIIESVHLTVSVQFRFSKRHKKRIIKKFERDTKNFRIEPDLTLYKSGGVIFCHPMVGRKIKEMFGQS